MKNILHMGRPIVRGSKTGTVPVAGETRALLVELHDRTGLPMKRLVALATQVMADMDDRSIMLLAIAHADRR